ncbi:Eco47II family restriction endonuclease [Canibacter sp. lx-72]|uniref:Eco47II family restriction endonuclease n=1 Tax=Canibacter zhuwentaonis TaxID=2837491 RepID=UPI001BDBCA27|nr:Eco47II family restriction endonuclease [Canibacter zhuwentaonis]MBT1017919.1 Eco47II family restriction endonuclease [Canibacter zhuwentaonis]
METSRQFKKTLSNAIGAFHQNLLGALPGWTSTGRSGGVIDIVHKEEFGVTGRSAIGEVKNKFNTLNASGKQTLYDNFQDALKWNYKGYNCYLVEVIQKTPKPQHPWKVANRGEREDIRLISASEVYKISTGDDQAFSKFFTVVNKLLLKNISYHPMSRHSACLSELLVVLELQERNRLIAPPLPQIKPVNVLQHNSLTQRPR